MTLKCKETEEQEFDFVVVGGGLAGLCCAVAAARKNIKTAIVQDRPMFGGNSSTEIRVVPLGSACFNAWGRETGIVEELLLEDRATNHVHLFEHGMTNTHWDLILYEAVKRETNLTMFMNTTVRAVDSEATDKANPAVRRITGVHGSQLGSEREFVFRARAYADCTGDATVGALAGADFRYGREARGEFNEPLAPVASDDVTNGSTITMRARNIGRPVPYAPPEWVAVYKSLDDIGPFRKVAHIKRQEYGGYWWLEVGSPYRQIEDTQAIKEELLKHVLGVWNYIKNYSPDKEIARNYALEWIGAVPGKRESRRLMGDVVLTEHDVHSDPRWADAAVSAGWIIDLHIKGGILNKNEPGEPSHADLNYRHWIHVPPFSVPLRALYSRNVENLWMAGRNLSATHVAFGAVRVQSVLANHGQAVGTAAAYALQHDLSPRQTARPDGEHIKKIRQQLIRDDVQVLGYENEDSSDLARRAKVSATSDAPLDFGEPQTDVALTLDKPRAQVFPVTHDSVDSIAAYLKNESFEAVEITVDLHELERIWERGNGVSVVEKTAVVPANFEGWLNVELNARTAQNKPHRISLRAPHSGEQISWAAAQKFPTGTTASFLHVSPGGCEPQNEHFPTLQPHETALPAYEHWIQNKWFAHSLRVTPAPRPFQAENVNNGNAWTVGMPNLWISNPVKKLPQSCTLDFGKSVTFNTVLITFDTDLNLIVSQMPDFWRAATGVRDWRLYAHSGGEKRLLHEETDNYQRRRTIRFETVTANKLELEVLATNMPAPEPAKQGSQAGANEDEVYPVEAGGPTSKQTATDEAARVFEIRVYNE